MSLRTPMKDDQLQESDILHCNGIRVFVVQVPGDGRARSADAVQRQRCAAREALDLCAEDCGAPSQGWSQDVEGAPIPNKGWYWSISHKRIWAGAVISRDPIGLDIEAVVPRKTELYEEVADVSEWNLIGGCTWSGFFRLWTAKEATLKANGVGIGLMNECRIDRIESNNRPHMIVSMRNGLWRVEHLHFDDHIAAVARLAQ